MAVYCTNLKLKINQIKTTEDLRKCAEEKFDKIPSYRYGAVELLEWHDMVMRDYQVDQLIRSLR